eukprot:799108-Pyramimonas_sp.AAC.1
MGGEDGWRWPDVAVFEVLYLLSFWILCHAFWISARRPPDGRSHVDHTRRVPSRRLDQGRVLSRGKISPAPRNNQIRCTGRVTVRTTVTSDVWGVATLES